MTADAVRNWTEVAVPDVRVGQSVTSLDMGSE
jgi:hypothetical protein